MTTGSLGWDVLPLSKVLQKLNNGRLLQQGWSPRCLTHPASDEQTWAVVKTTAIQAGWFDETKNKELPAGLHAKPGIEILEGDLLMTCAGPRSRCGVPALVRHTRPRLMMSGKMYRFRPLPFLDSRFLEMWLLSSEAQGRIDKMKTGISDSGLNLTQDRFLELPVPIPPVEEQRRIVDSLEDHFSRLEAATSYLRTAKVRTDRWAAGMSDSLIWAPAYPEVQLASLLREPMRNGRSDRAAGPGVEGIKTLTLTAVTQGEFSDANTKVTTTSPSVARDLWLEPGDIFVQRANTPELVGTAARFDGPREWAIFPDLLIRVRPDEAIINSRFLVAALRSERSHRSLRAKAKGLAGSMPKIDQATLAAVRVPLPPPGEQAAIVERLTHIDDASATLSTSIHAHEVRASGLRRALLAAAFSGKLSGRHADVAVDELAMSGGRHRDHS